MAGHERGNMTADDQVLEAIFNPENPVGGLDLDDDVTGVVNGEVDESLETEEVKRAKVLEVQAVRMAESGNLSEALQLLNQAVSEAPNYASVYNNRAQVYRLQNEIDLALADLDTAIQLSSHRGRVAEQAHTQRGLIRQLHGENDGALEDFKAAAKLGSKFAQRQVVKMNPYAALCNQMLSEAFDKLRRGEEV